MTVKTYIIYLIFFFISINSLLAVNISKVETPYNRDYLYVEKPYPLPAVMEVNINVWWDPKYEFKTENVTIYNTKGTKVNCEEELKVEKEGSWYGTLTWNTSGVNSGVYLIIIKHGSAEKLVKVLVG